MKLRTHSAFTLIELLLYVSASSIMLLIVSIFFSALLQARVKHETINEVDQQGTRAMQLITQAIRNSTSVTAVSGSTLMLNLPSGSTTFDVNNETLRITEGSSPATPLTSSRVRVVDINFTDLARPTTPGLVGIVLTIEAANPEGRNEREYEQTFRSTAALRH